MEGSEEEYEELAAGSDIKFIPVPAVAGEMLMFLLDGETVIDWSIDPPNLHRQVLRSKLP